jgi:hypothetical protein
MRCGACGARNPATATWCSQCFAGFGQPATPTPPAGEHAPTQRDAVGAATPGTEDRDVAGVPAPGPASTARDVREHEGGIEWRCPVCDGWSSLHATSCHRCGAARTGFGVDAPAPVEGRELERLVALTVLLPGLGHLRAGRVGTGLARAVVAFAWLVGAVVLGVGAVRSGAAPVAALPLLLGAVVVWVASVRDVRALAGPERRELLDARGLLWLVAAVTGLLAGALLLDTMRLATG